MFGRKKKQALFNEVDINRQVAHDFHLRSTVTGFESYRVAGYRLYHKLEEYEMIPKLEEHLAKLLTGQLDDANGDMLDAIIFGPAREGLPDLERQHADHGDTIRRLISRRTADREDLYRILKDREEELKVMEAAYKKTCENFAKANGEV